MMAKAFSGNADSQREHSIHRIEADLLIPGRGEPIKDGVVILDENRISYAGPAGDAPQKPQAVRHRATAILPGL